MNRMKPTESYNKQDAILLAGFCYQTYPFFDQNKLDLPMGFELCYSFSGIGRGD